MSKPWMPLYVADYLRDTRRLTAAEHGAYLLLIMEYWTAGGLPDDDRQLARIASMTAREWQRARPIIEAFFAAGWRHKRIDAELAHAADVSSKRRASAQQRRGNSEANAGAIASANAEQKDTHAGATSPSPSPSQSQEKKSSLRSESVNDGWPPDFQERFWEQYPRKVAKDAAMKALERVRKSRRVTWGVLHAAVLRYAAVMRDSDPQYVNHPATWLNAGRWADDPKALTRSTGPPPNGRPRSSAIELELAMSRDDQRPDDEADPHDGGDLLDLTVAAPGDRP